MVKKQLKRSSEPVIATATINTTKRCGGISLGRVLLGTIACAFCAMTYLGYHRQLQQYYYGFGDFKSNNNNDNNNTKSKSKSNLPVYPKVTIDKQHPVFSLGLPNTGMAILPRYFQCAGYSDDGRFGRQWITQDQEPESTLQKSIGLCMKHNILAAKPNILEGCGDYDVWHDLFFRKAPFGTVASSCFDPVLYPQALENLFQSFPNATIINTIKRPAREWYRTVSFDLHDHWKEWCNPTHDDAFPTENTETAYLEFYEGYHERLRQFVKQRPGWTLIELELELSNPSFAELDAAKNEEIADRLEAQLGVPAKCWMESVQGKIQLLDVTNSTNTAATTTITTDTTTGADPTAKYKHLLERPNDIAYPLLVVSLPKSGTSTLYKYFECNLGFGASSHQWVTRSLPPHEGIGIGTCMQENMKAKLPVLYNCGHSRVYTDIGIFNNPKQQCFYPQLHNKGEALNAFAESYPYATIMLMVRDSREWVDSAQRWHDLTGRWSTSPWCGDEHFPPVGASSDDWKQFYENHVDTVREFVRGHPTLTYIEIPLTDDAEHTLNNIFGFQKKCWGTWNANLKNPQARL